MSTALRVLLVEDREDDAELIARELRRGGFEPTVERVATADGMRAALEGRQWEVVLCDYVLPGFSAEAALALLREQAPDVPLIVVSGQVGEETAADLMKAGARDFVMKGSLARLVPAVQRELREARHRRERHRVERERSALARLNATVLATMPSSLLVLDGELRVVLANQQFLRGWGLAPKDVHGRSVEEVLPAGLEELDRVLEAIRGVMETGRQDEILGLSARTGTESNRWLNIRLCAIQQPSPESVASHERRVLLVIDDVTEQRLLQKRVHQIARLEAIGRLAGGIAHDFNNVLTGVIGFAQLSLASLGDDPETASHIREIKALGTRAAGLTRQILAFSRKQALSPIVLDLNNVVRSSLTMLGQLIGEDIAIEFLPGADLGNVRVDHGQIEQVLVNLAVNARDAMPRGGTLVIETANVVFDQAYADLHVGAKPGHYVLLTVTDTGCGMDPATAERAFEPFFTTKGEDQGTGLGLSTVYGIVKQHGGNVWVYSEVGRGTAVKVYLPRVSGEVAEPVAEQPPPRATRGSETILVVEDRKAVRDVVRLVLEERGYRVLAAASPTEAESIAERHGSTIDLMIADVVLPERTGWDLYEDLHARNPALKVLYMSGYSGRAAEINGEVDADAPFLVKPFTPAVLAGKVREVLDATLEG